LLLLLLMLWQALQPSPCFVGLPAYRCWVEGMADEYYSKPSSKEAKN